MISYRRYACRSMTLLLYASRYKMRPLAAGDAFLRSERAEFHYFARHGTLMNYFTSGGGRDFY